MERLRSENTDLKSPPAYDQTLSVEIPADPQRLATSLFNIVGRLRIKRGSDTEISIDEHRYRDIDRSLEGAPPKLGFSKTHDGETSRKFENVSSIYAINRGRVDLYPSRTLLSKPESKLRVNAINLSNKSIKLRRKTALGVLEKVYHVKQWPEVNSINNIESEVDLPKHLQPLIDKTSPKLTEAQRNEIKGLVLEYRDIFTGPDGKLGRTDLLQHIIDTGNAKPIKIPPRRVPMFQKEIIENEIHKMLDEDIIQPSNSPWSSPILLVAKKK
ncbi:unnamed protein product [Mytilus coruscus]|uniref:Peptidase A9 domain-containing protein n=1 Tax=Mytilus coruscus TaxID=42192 RepID=A0A6J8DXQ2_MYTCO|nr:unnamed protein product [Mytilus coruscus]